MNIPAKKPDTAPFPIDPSHVKGHVHREKEETRLEKAGQYIQIFILVSAILAAVFHARSEAFITFAIIFSSIVLEAFPFMLLGTLLGGLVEVFLSRDRLVSFLPANRKAAVFGAAFLGIIFPVCECAIVPVVRKFIQKGMPIGSAVAFLLAGPIVNPLVFGSTLVAYSFDWGVAGLRTFSGLAIAVGTGLFIDSNIRSKEAILPGGIQPCGCSHDHCAHDHSAVRPESLMGKIKAALYHGAADFYDIGRFLIMGALIAAALQTLVDRQDLLVAQASPFAAIPAAMILAFVLNLCSEADAFIAASFRPMGIPLSAQLAFMVLGPMLDIKLILMYLGVFTRKMILLLILMVVLSVFTVMACLEVASWL